MVFPERPPPDACEASYRVAPNFHARPGLVPVSTYKSITGQYHPLRPVCHEVRIKLMTICRQHNARVCSYLGLYIAGTRPWVDLPERERIVVLVLELLSDDLRRWYEFDGKVRALLDEICLDDVSLADRQVCVRYYRFRREDEQLYPENPDDNYQHLRDSTILRQARIDLHARDEAFAHARAQNLLRTTRTLPAPVNTRPRLERMQGLLYSYTTLDENESNVSTPRMGPSDAALSPPLHAASHATANSWALVDDFQLPPLPDLSEWLLPRVRDSWANMRPRSARRGSVSSTASRP